MILQPLNSGGAQPRRRRYKVNETPDGSRQLFSTPVKFIAGVEYEEQVYYNGQQIDPGATEDYTIDESGGPGTGFDQILLNFAPKTDDKIWVWVVPKP